MQMLAVRLFLGGFDPEFQFGADGDDEVFDFRFFRYPQFLTDVCFGQEGKDFLFERIDRLFENRTGADFLAVVDQERGDFQGAHGALGDGVDVLFVVVDKPLDFAVGDDLHPGVIKRGDFMQDDTRTVGLNAFRKEFERAIEELTDRDLFIRGMAALVDSDQGNKLDFRVFAQSVNDGLQFYRRLKGINQIFMSAFHVLPPSRVSLDLSSLSNMCCRLRFFTFLNI